VLLSVGDCRINDAYAIPGADSVKIYTVPGDSLVTTIIPRKFRHFSIELNLVKADYRIRYKNNFGQCVTRSFNLHNDTTNIELCPDSLVSYSENTLLKLKAHDSLEITFHSRGCFNDDLMRLTVKKEGTKLIARLYQRPWHNIAKRGKHSIQKRRYVLLKEKALDEADIISFVRFENELQFAHSGGCTTTDWYSVSSKYLTISKEDGNCGWNGFYILRTSWFGEERK
jgi:hypothetical protein